MQESAHLRERKASRLETTSTGRLHMDAYGEGPSIAVVAQNWEGGRPHLSMRCVHTNREHIVWECHLHYDERRRNRIASTARGDWGGLDDPIWVPNDDVEGREETDEEQVDGVERFFEYLAFQF